MTTVAISLNDKHQEFIREEVNAGLFASESEVVATALDILKTREELRKEQRAELRREVRKGIEELDRGETADFDLLSFLGKMNAQWSSRNA